MPKSSAYPPLDGLLDLACRDGVDIRPTLLRVLTDLYVQKPTHTAYEETQYVELAQGLINGADASTRAAVAASLRGYSGAPKSILDTLAAAESRAPHPLTPLEAPAPPQPAPKPAPKRPSDDLADLFFAAPSSERRLILANIDVVGTPRAQLLAPAHETVAHLEAAALQRDPRDFARTLESALGLDHALAERIATDEGGEAVVVVARAIGMKAAVLQRILLFLNPAIGQSIDRVYDLADLFGTLTPQAAAHMLSTWRKPAARKQVPHAPVLYDDERRRARPSAGETRSAPRPEQAGRLKNNGNNGR